MSRQTQAPNTIAVAKNGTAIGIAICTLTASAGAIQLFPAGEFGATDGRGPWRLGEATAKALIDKVKARANDLVVDYEHQSILSKDNGMPAPAAGWIKSDSLRFEMDKGLFADNPSWTTKAKAHIKEGEYKYVSPVFSYNPKSGKILDLLHVALTNHPALDGMSEVTLAAATRFLTQKENMMSNDKKTLLTSLVAISSLSLKEDATDDDALAAITALTTKVADLERQIKDKDESIAAAKTTASDKDDSTDGDAKEAVATATITEAVSTMNQY